jgi:hypothetical protein
MRWQVVRPVDRAAFARVHPLSSEAPRAMIRAMAMHEVRPATVSAVPTRAEAEAIARDLLGDEGTRLAHVCTAGSMAARLGVLFDADEAALLVAAATLHDVGYAPRIAQTGFHPLDGALYLRSIGLPERLCSLVAHHSEADMLATQHGVLDLDAQFPRERSLLADALVYADMHSAPDGQMIRAEHRLADISRRRPDPVEAVRAARLRTAMARVGAALQAHAEQVAAGTPVLIPGPRDWQGDDWWRAEDRYGPALDG